VAKASSLHPGDEPVSPDLAEVERLASIGLLAASIVHDINNPLSYLMANRELLAELLTEIGRAPGIDAAIANQLAEARALVDEMGLGAKQIRSIARDVLGYARRENAEAPMGVDVHEVLESCLNLTRGEIAARATVVRRFGNVPRVRGDAQRLMQVFTNLLVNAAQALSEASQASNEIVVATRVNDGGRVEVAISDNGVGLTPEVTARLFEPFFTTKGPAAGTGLGLSICRRLVTSMGGGIHVVSTAGLGATFSVELLSMDGPPRSLDESASIAPAAARGRILVVDDDPLVGRSIARLLADHDVVVATDADAAMSALHDGDASFDLVLCDVVMPGRDGPSLYGRVMAEHLDAASRFVFMSAGVPSGALRGVEGVALLAKPLDVPALCALVERRVASRVLRVDLLDTSTLLGYPALPNGDLAFVLEGGCDTESGPDLGRSLSQLHVCAVRRRSRAVTLDLRGLEHMTSSGLKAILTWLDGVEGLPAERRYVVRFLTDRAKHWQARSLGAVVGLMGDGAVVVDG
jgi:CheY-like chemotaxis protein/two-component sensor histidine kinase